MTVFSGHELDDCPLCRRPLLCPPRYCRSVPGEPWGGRDRLKDLSLRLSGFGAGQRYGSGQFGQPTL